MNIDNIKFDSKGLVPAIAQDSTTGEVLMLAYMNAESLKKTLETMRAHYYSRSRQELWEKGATSGNTQEVVSISYDCDGDTLLMKIKQTGVACHTGEPSCFFNSLTGNGTSVNPMANNTNVDNISAEDTSAHVITELYRTIIMRKGSSPKESYVASLFEKGDKAIAAKIFEESAELISAAKETDKAHIVHELCDLWFHTLVLLAKDDLPLSDVFKELKRRAGTSGLEEKASRKKKS